MTEPVDLQYVAAHFNPADPRLAATGPLLGDGMWKAVELMLEQCPVVRSDGQWYGMPEGGWIAGRYRDVMRVLTETETFSSVGKKGTEDEPDLPPFDVDPPIHGEFRRLLQPFFSNQSAGVAERAGREIITQLIDQVIDRGSCDAVVDLTRPYSSLVKWAWLVRVVGLRAEDPTEVQEWIEIWLHRHFAPEFESASKSLMAWIDDSILQRREAPREPDLLDALLHGSVDDRPLTHEEIRGVIVIMMQGGIAATGGVIANILFRLAVYPELQDEVRRRWDRLPAVIEELMRIEPPVTGIARRCTRETVLSGRTIKENERIYYLVHAANRDPQQFPNPLAVDFERKSNRHFAFGGGPHRCIGATVARRDIRVAVREILGRMQNLRLDLGGTPRRSTGNEWRLDSLPITFRKA